MHTSELKLQELIQSHEKESSLKKKLWKMMNKETYVLIVITS
jgi:hypothetical protein